MSPNSSGALYERKEREEVTEKQEDLKVLLILIPQKVIK